MTHRDRICSPSGRRRTAGDARIPAGHRQGFSTPSDGLHTRPGRRLPATFGQRRARLAMPSGISGIAATHGPCRKSRKVVSMNHYQCSLVLSNRNHSDARRLLLIGTRRCDATT
jgi:hypothetical protein